jgi:hypothetical protein
MTWARYEHAQVYCAVDAVRASVHTACRGRWPASDAYVIHDDPPAQERCGGCMVELGLRELRDAVPVVTEAHSVLFEGVSYGDVE